MATTTDIKVTYEGRNYIEVTLQAIGDTAIGSTILLDKSALNGPADDGGNASNSVEPGSLSLMEAEFTVTGFAYCQLAWDHTVNDEILTMTGNALIDYRETGGNHDPKSAGGTGDVLFVAPLEGTPTNAAIHARLLFRKKQ